MGSEMCIRDSHYMGNVGFIGVGYMGYGIAKNILEKDNNLFVIANKNRKPIEKIVSKGAVEVKSFEDFRDKQLNVLVKCVTCLLYTSPSPRDGLLSRMPSSA